MRILGLDVGIASIGWGLVELERPEENSQKHGAIIACGVWTFDPPEEWSRDGALSKAQIRREQRGRRRNFRRRRQRMRLIRGLFHRHGLLPNEDRDALRWTGPAPIALRRRALSAPLAPAELAVALSHIARRRGFKSNAAQALAHSARRADARGQRHSARPGLALHRAPTPGVRKGIHAPRLLAAPLRKRGLRARSLSLRAEPETRREAQLFAGALSSFGAAQQSENSGGREPARPAPAGNLPRRRRFRRDRADHLCGFAQAPRLARPSALSRRRGKGRGRAGFRDAGGRVGRRFSPARARGRDARRGRLAGAAIGPAVGSTGSGTL